MRAIRCAVWGLGTAVALWLILPFLLQAGVAPRDLFTLMPMLVLVPLGLAAWLVRFSGGLVGILCGMAFGTPIIATIYLLVREDTAAHGGLAAPLSLAAYVIALLSLAVMGLTGLLRGRRDTVQHKAGDNDA